MYDSGKIIVGILVFVILFTSPIWYNFTIGETSKKPDPVVLKVEGKLECVRSAEYMRALHMDLLNEWRDEVVRNDIRTFTTASGKVLEKSLTHTCMDCHANKAEFCDQCHNYVAVTPHCWDCHIEPPKMGNE